MTPSEVHVSRPLTNLSIAYLQTQNSFVAGQVFPNVSVQKQADIYYKYPRDAFNRNGMRRRAPNTQSAGTDYAVTTDTYYCVVWALHHDISDDVRANVDDQINPDRDATNLLTMQGLINREAAFVAKYFAGGIWTGGDYDGVAAAPATGQFIQWDQATSTPIEDVRAYATNVQERTGGFRPNTLVLGRRVLDKLIDHPDLIDRIKYSGGVSPSQPAIVNMQALAALFEVNRVVVMNGVANSANEGATESNAFLGGKHALLVYAAPSPGVMMPSAGYTFVWTNRVGASAASQGFVISKFRRAPEYKADRVEVEAAYDQKLVAADLGVFLENAVAA